MKKIFVLLSMVITTQIFAQNYPITGINISLPSVPDANTAHWESGTSLFIISATARAVSGRIDDVLATSRILVTIKKQGAKVCGLYTIATAPVSNLNSLNKVWSGKSALMLLGQDCILTPGEYELCVQFFGHKNEALSAEKSKSFSIREEEKTSFLAPQNISPSDGWIVGENDAKSPLTFRWTPVVPKPQGDTYYKVKVFEIKDGQSALTAFTSSSPIIDKEIKNQTQLSGILLSNLAIAENSKIGWCVQASSKEGKTYGENDGISEFSAFTLKSKSIPPIAPVTTTSISTNDTIYAGENGEFAIITTSVIVSNGKYTGEGTAYIGWLKARINVEFDTITVDVNKNLLTGKVLGQIDDSPPTYPTDWALEAAANLQFTNSITGRIVSWINNKTNQSIPYQNLQEFTTPVKLPLGVNFSDGNQLAITEMVFRSDKSEINIVAAKTTPASWGATQTVGFIAKSLEFHPSNIVTPPKRIELIEDLIVGNTNNNIVFKLKKPDTNHSGCYVAWGEDGFSEYGIEIETLFTRSWLIPSPDHNGKVSALFTSVGTEWNDMILTGKLERSEIVGTSGMVILADSLSFDMSDVMNPASITFPVNYNGDTTVHFSGFYMKLLEMELPQTWQTSNNSPPKVSIQNMIIDNMGITLYAQATDIISFPNARIADLEASIDTIHVEIEASSVTEAGIKGRIGIPLSKSDSIQNPLKYIGLFNQAQNSSSVSSFQFSIEPTGPINAHLLKGTMELAQTSNIVAYVDKTKKTFDMELNGKFSWVNIKLGPIKNVNMGLKFQGLKMGYNSTSSTGLTFSAGSWSFASPQKFLANFPVSLENIAYQNLTPTSGQLMHGKLNFSLVCNLSEDIGGITKMGVEVAIKESPVYKFIPVYINTTIDSIAVHASTAAVKIDGSVGFRNDDPIFGNGFIGNLSAEFKAISLKISALAEFGNTTYQYGSLYRYWRVQAEATLPAPGVPFLPGIAFRGFGGGAYNNMNPTLSNNAYTFKPKKSNFGFIATGVIATTPKEETFNADIGLLANFSASQGLTYIGFTGDFYVAASLQTNSRAKAKIKGDIDVSYNFPAKHFNLSASVNVDANPIKTPNPAALILDINGKTNEWFFKFGEPSNLNTVNVFGINLYEYLMFGNKIPSPSGFTPYFANAYSSIFPGTSLSGNVGTGGVGEITATGKGFAMGIGFKFNKADTKNIEGNYYLYYELAAGAELNLALNEYSGSCSGISPLGINGWRAKGGWDSTVMQEHKLRG